MKLETVLPVWRDEPIVIVAAPGPSLTAGVAQQCRGHPTIAVQDAWRLLPWAEVLYGCDANWWRAHGGCPAFAGDRWTTHHAGGNDKGSIAEAYQLHCVAGKQADEFSLDPTVIAYGSNSGFQAVNLALLRGARKIILVGFDMRKVEGRAHFFGDHPKPLRTGSSYHTFIAAFNSAAAKLSVNVQIVNSTPGSALRCFPLVPLDAALSQKAAA